jgi:hypothetical protein
MLDSHEGNTMYQYFGTQWEALKKCCDARDRRWQAEYIGVVESGPMAGLYVIKVW